MNKVNRQAGFAPLLVLAVIALIGGGVYIAKKHEQKKALQIQDNVETQANAHADTRANPRANLGSSASVNANANTGTLKSFLAMRKDTTCTLDSTMSGVATKGTVFITASGNMRGDFVSTPKTGSAIESHIIIQAGTTAYVWSGANGSKMNLERLNASANASADQQSSKYVDLNQKVTYTCSDWAPDQQKFVIPSGINFVDIEALLKGTVKVKLP